MSLEKWDKQNISLSSYKIYAQVRKQQNVMKQTGSSWQKNKIGKLSPYLKIMRKAALEDECSFKSEEITCIKLKQLL